ncbi:MAG: hypothetical protein [Partitiviridae sp.]|nr:MAG: hypothetical protein [Partitiviridae sp.]
MTLCSLTIICAYPFLYDRTKPNYKDEKMNRWIIIGEEFGLTGELFPSFCGVFCACSVHVVKNVQRGTALVNSTRLMRCRTIDEPRIARDRVVFEWLEYQWKSVFFAERRNLP